MTEQKGEGSDDYHLSQLELEEELARSFVWTRRQWNSWQVAKYHFLDLDSPHWDTHSGGVVARAPQLFIYGYVLCNRMVEGDLAHSCRHGEGPHRIKVCVTRKDNDPIVFARLIEVAGPKPIKR